MRFMGFSLIESGKTIFYEGEKVRTTLYIDFAPTADMTEKAAGYQCTFVYKNSQKKATVPQQYIFARVNIYHLYLKSIGLNIMPAPDHEAK